MEGRTPALRIVAVTQTPPPFLGQALAGQSFLAGNYRTLEVFHVRMSFSRGVDDVGKPRLGKLVHVCRLITRILCCRARTGAQVLYYPPAGPDLTPVLRDLLILLSTRWAFRFTVFHFHAAGLSEIESRLPWPLRFLFRAGYSHPDLAIQTSALNPPDGRSLGARRVAIVANGVGDHPLARRPRRATIDGPPVLLYVGVLRESKGLLVLVEACRRLRQRGFDFRLHLMGAFASSQFELALKAAIRGAELADRVSFLGVLIGDAKAERFQASDIFCYPSHFEAESFGRVLVEAMQFSLPIVTTRWRGIPSVVTEGENAILVPVKDAAALEAALAQLLGDGRLRVEMGQRGRERYVQHFTEEHFQQAMENALSAIAR
jgi:glycosyltransferase involved in cell wall biosynthesis